jgi:hypothetical protein
VHPVDECPVQLEQRLTTGEDDVRAPDQRTVGGDYFRAMEIPLLEGRLFTSKTRRRIPAC